MMIKLLKMYSFFIFGFIFYLKLVFNLTIAVFFLNCYLISVLKSHITINIYIVFMMMVIFLFFFPYNFLLIILFNIFKLNHIFEMVIV